MAGQAIIRSSWIGNAIFAATAVPAVFVEALEPAAVVVSLALFAASLGVWVWAFAVAVVRSSQGDNIAVGNLFLFEGDAPKAVRRQLFASVGACLLITAVTAAANPFGVLVPMLPLGFVGLWGARHGEFELRPGLEPEIRPLRPDRSAGRSGQGKRAGRSDQKQGVERPSRRTTRGRAGE